ncbi:SDR family NAD(P)-dependent oxidoreductase [Nocardia sp. CA-151230]|uniref:SDR family NAD(P)-dependent oxidoreductase n=1 Tax=Nocardia sp. CA-151230 TaxID=3239982 RepID=UPI003D8F17F2
MTRWNDKKEPRMPRYNLEGRTVAITGATGGLGRALATELRRGGARLALMATNQAALDELCGELGSLDQARGWQVDVRDFDSVRTAVDAAAQHFGGIDVVIANAGVEAVAPVSKTDPDEFARLVDINLNGVWRTFKAGLPHARKRRGYLLAISSMAAFVHSPLQTGYTASKAGVWALCDSLRLEVRHEGVTVASAHPTFFPTPMTDNMVADPAGRTLWGGHSNLLWRMVSLESVVDQIVRGIESRSEFIVAPSHLAFVAKLPGLFRPLVESVGFSTKTITTAIELATPSRGRK